MKKFQILLISIILLVSYWHFEKRPRIVVNGAKVTRTMGISKTPSPKLENILNSELFLTEIKKRCKDYSELTETWNLTNVSFNVNSYNQDHNILYSFPIFSSVHGEFSWTAGFNIVNGNHKVLNKEVTSRTNSIIKIIEDAIHEEINNEKT